MALSGRQMEDIEVNTEWIGIIRDLFDVRISEKEENIRKYDNYIYSTFKCFVKHKRRLWFSMHCLSHCDINFRNLIMGQLVDIDEWKNDMVSDINDKNLPKKHVLTTFDNVEQLV